MDIPRQTFLNPLCLRMYNSPQQLTSIIEYGLKIVSCDPSLKEVKMQEVHTIEMEMFIILPKR